MRIRCMCHYCTRSCKCKHYIQYCPNPNFIIEDETDDGKNCQLYAPVEVKYLCR